MPSTLAFSNTRHNSLMKVSKLKLLIGLKASRMKGRIQDIVY